MTDRARVLGGVAPEALKAAAFDLSPEPALVVDRDSMTVWRITREDLISAAAIDEIEPLLSGEGAAQSAARPDGRKGDRSPGPGPGREKILATTYFPEGLPPQYLRRWRA